MTIELLTQDLKTRASIIHEEIYSSLEKEGYNITKKNSLVFDIVENDEINGGSRCFENEDFIKINSGVIKTFYEYFIEVNEYYKNNILKQWMPNEDEEEIEKMSMEGVYWQNDNPLQFDSKNIIEQRARLLEIFVSRFILLHEIGHIFNGHCNFVASKEEEDKYIPMYYFDDKSEKNVCDLDIRTMEMDADAFAATQTIRHLIYLYKTFDKNTNSNGIKPMELFYLWAFAIRSHFLLCEDRYGDSEKYYKSMKHLPSNARWLMIMTTAIELIDTSSLEKSEIDEVQVQFGRGISEAEKVFNNLKITHYSFSDQFEDNKNFNEYSLEVNQNWIDLVKELNDFSRCPLYKA